ncbi:MAG: hypothetical protein ACRD0D_09165, partial [Acidimicrobiales bacterium]
MAKAWNDWQQSMRDSWAQMFPAAPAPAAPTPEQMAEAARQALESMRATVKQVLDAQRESLRVWIECVAHQAGTPTEVASALRAVPPVVDSSLQGQQAFWASLFETARTFDPSTPPPAAWAQSIEAWGTALR